MQVFISYAEEDSITAKKIADKLSCSGFLVSYFEDVQRRGGIIFDKLENDLKNAGAFFALLSENYLRSNWCRVEFEVAFHMEREARSKNKQFEIQILKVGSVKRDGLVFERIYDWVDINNDAQLDGLLTRLKKQEGENQENMAEKRKTKGDWVPFTNRTEEIRNIINNLTNPSGMHFQVIVAPPQMGKTWLLNKVALELLKVDERWIIQTVALSNNQNARSNLVSLLKAFNFQLDSESLVVSESTLNDIVKDVALQIVKSKRPWLLLLDDAESLDRKTAKVLRSVMAIVKEQIKGASDVRLAFIAASRAEISEFSSFLPRPPFAQQLLTPFTDNVVADLVGEIARTENFTTQDREYAPILLEITEGLPALISIYLTWMKDKGFIPAILKDISEPCIFEELAENYIQEYLLSSDVLIPNWASPRNQEDARLFWVQLVLNSSMFRLIARPHIRILEQKNQGGTQEFEPNSEDLLDEFGNLPMVVPVETIWYRMYPAIRRLLFKYYYKTREEQAKAHQECELFYQEYIKELTGTDRIAFIVEQIWHRTEYLRLVGKSGSDAKQSLMELISAICQDEKQHVNGLSYGDFIKGLMRSIEDDSELPIAMGLIEKDLADQIKDYLLSQKEQKSKGGKP